MSLKYELFEPVYVTSWHAFGEVLGFSDGEVLVHLYHRPQDETFWVREDEVLENKRASGSSAKP